MFNHIPRDEGTERTLAWIAALSRVLTITELMIESARRNDFNEYVIPVAIMHALQKALAEYKSIMGTDA